MGKRLTLEAGFSRCFASVRRLIMQPMLKNSQGLQGNCQVKGDYFPSACPLAPTLYMAYAYDENAVNVPH